MALQVEEQVDATNCKGPDSKFLSGQLPKLETRYEDSSVQDIIATSQLFNNKRTNLATICDRLHDQRLHQPWLEPGTAAGDEERIWKRGMPAKKPPLCDTPQPSAALNIKSEDSEEFIVASIKIEDLDFEDCSITVAQSSTDVDTDEFDEFEMHVENNNEDPLAAASEFLSSFDFENSQLTPNQQKAQRRKYYVRSALTNRALLREQLQLKAKQQPMEDLIKSAIGPNCLSFTPKQAALLIKSGVGK